MSLSGDLWSPCEGMSGQQAVGNLQPIDPGFDFRWPQVLCYKLGGRRLVGHVFFFQGLGERG